MRELAVLRLQFRKLPTRRDEASAEALGVADRAIQLADALREDAAASQRRYAEFRKEFDRYIARVDALIDSLPFAIVTTDIHATIVHANRAASALLGRGTATLKNQLLLHYADDRAAFAAIVRQLPDVTDALTASVRLRPCQRAPFDAVITIVADTRSDGDRLWILEHDGRRRAERSGSSR
jgi:PAS domain-containing protein